jgi:hypothetical protein
VRSHILEERPIQVRSLQHALQHYRDIQTHTREARSREEALAAIDRNYQRAEQADRLGLAWRWVEQEAAFNALEAELDPRARAWGGSPPRSRHSAGASPTWIVNGSSPTTP